MLAMGMFNLRNFVIFIGLGLVLGGCTTIPASTTSQPQVQETYLKSFCQRHSISCQWDGVAQVVTLRVGEAKIKALIGSRVVIVDNQQKIILNDSLKIVESAVVIPADFRRVVIERLKKESKQKVEYSFKRIKEVVIDAGHGGKDPGALGNSGSQEKKVVLDIAKRLKRILSRQGIKVTMTRDTDEFISLKKRTEIASQSKADLFISIHANASTSRSAHGVEVYSLKDLGYLERNEEQRQVNEKHMFKNLSMKKSDRELGKIISDMLYSYKQSESKVLGKKMVLKIADFTNAKNRGLKKARFYVLRNTLIPSVLVEVGFISNPKEERLLKKSAYRQKIAHWLARSILDYVKE